ncbi:MAG: PhzF family phenazine biosynthesis protein [Ancalomicrobiaceae bacterium]|nr:PhzF family phenazine biosynthesis protein [Ancalomicrobiaceae bacterium]
MSRPYAVLDVFTRHALAGNPLAVVFEADGLSSETMQKLAREFGLPETVFILTPSRPNHTAKLRIFTPGRELDFAGHPTVGAAAILASRRFGEVEKAMDAMIVVEENVGPVRCSVKLDPAGAAYAEFGVPRLAAPLSATFGERGAVADALGLSPADIGFENHRPSAWTCGAPFIFIPVAGLDAMARTKLAVENWYHAFGTSDRVGAYLYTRECVNHDSRFHARMFAPEAGIPEDPATGAAAAAFAGVILSFDAPTDGLHHFRIEQGIEMGRPSLVDLTIEVEGGMLKAERIGGYAVMLAEGELAI